MAARQRLAPPTLAEVLAEAMAAHQPKLTAGKLAVASGVDPSLVRRYLVGKLEEATPRNAARLAKALGIEPATLVFRGQW